MTPLDALIESLAVAGRYDPAFQARPEAVLWCDPEHSFERVIPLLRSRMSNLFALGPWEPGRQTGPAFHLRTQANRLESEGGPVPVFWLPGVAREILKAAGKCPAALEPLAWLVASGVWFGHVNGKDWTLRAFLTSSHGPVRLSIADGADAREALALVASTLMQKDLEWARGRTFDVEALNAIDAPDLNDDVLAWLDGRLDPETEPGRFKGFAGRAHKSLGFDPRKRTRQDGVRAMADRQGGWSAVWDRFSGAAEYTVPGVTKILSAEEPPAAFGQEETYPVANQRAEVSLREGLLKMAGLTRSDACQRLINLEATHGHRRETLWGRRGQSPLAQALHHLVDVAKAAPWSGVSAEAMAKAYVDQGAAVDGAAMQAIACAPASDDRLAVTSALRSVYLPWVMRAHVLCKA